MNPVADLPLARDIAAAVLATPGVLSLSGGPFGEVATHGPAERIQGVHLFTGEEGLVVEVRVVLGTLAIRAAAGDVRRAAAVAAGLAGQPPAAVDVFIDDVRTE